MDVQRAERARGMGRSTGIRLLHYGWPVVLGWALAEVAVQATGRPVSPAGRALLLLGIGAAYSFDRLVDPPASPTRVLRVVLGVAFVGCSAGVLGLLPWLPASSLSLLPLLAAAVVGYRKAKAFPLVKAFLVPLVWTWAGIALPLADPSWLGFRSLAQPVALPLFLVLASGCLLCDVNDVERDGLQGVRSLPVQVGLRWALVIAALLAVLGTAAALFQGRLGLAVDGLLLVLLAGCRPLLLLESWGPFVVDVVLTLPGFLIAVRRV